jgi:hypothetical protein
MTTILIIALAQVALGIAVGRLLRRRRKEINHD